MRFAKLSQIMRGKGSGGPKPFSDDHEIDFRKAVQITDFALLVEHAGIVRNPTIAWSLETKVKLIKSNCLGGLSPQRRAESSCACQPPHYAAAKHERHQTAKHQCPDRLTATLSKSTWVLGQLDKS